MSGFYGFDLILGGHPYISLTKQGNQTLQKGQYEMEALVMFEHHQKWSKNRRDVDCYQLVNVQYLHDFYCMKLPCLNMRKYAAIHTVIHSQVTRKQI